MNEQKHKPEPWDFVHKKYCIGHVQMHYCLLRDSNDRSIQYFFGKTEKEATADVARIAACVNHCKGATNEELKVKSHAQLKSQRFDLLFAMTEIAQILSDPIKSEDALKRAEEIAFNEIEKQLNIKLWKKL